MACGVNSDASLKKRRGGWGTTRLPLDLTNQRFGRWLALRHSHSHYWICRCDCGTEKPVWVSSLKRGTSKGCSECAVPSGHTRRTHGGTGTSLYGVYRGILRRCYKQNDQAFHNYGGRGIAVCDRWRNNFEAFRMDMGNRPRDSSIDRIDNDGPYSPENCRWATRQEQGRNRRGNVLLSLGKETLTISEWSQRLGVSRCAINWRVRKGWPIEKALGSPIRKWGTTPGREKS